MLLKAYSNKIMIHSEPHLTGVGMLSVHEYEYLSTHLASVVLVFTRHTGQHGSTVGGALVAGGTLILSRGGGVLAPRTVVAPVTRAGGHGEAIGCTVCP